MTDIYKEFIETSTTPCLGTNYLPYPPRLWNRSVTPCYEFINEATVYVPYLKREIPTSELNEVLAMIRKGNVLQYPANRTGNAKHKFSKIARGFWRRKKAWATQTGTFTHPNINKLQRLNSNIIANNPKDVFFFPECYLQNREKISENFPNPSDSSSEVNFPEIIPGPIIDGAIAYPLVPIPDTPINKLNPSIIDGGNLNTCTREDICSGAVLSALEDITCIPTSDSDVPGPIINLCYPKNIQITIPRQRTTYVSNATKWPTNGIITIPAYNTNLPLSRTPNIGVFLNDLSRLQG